MTKSNDRRTRRWIPIIVLMLGVFLNGSPAAADDSLARWTRTIPKPSATATLISPNSFTVECIVESPCGFGIGW